MGKPKAAAAAVPALTANAVRGEFLIKLDGADHVMRPSHEAILAFELTTGKSLILLALASTDGALTVRDMGMIAGECIREYGRQHKNLSHAGVTDEGVTSCIVDMGALHAIKPIQNMLLMAANGGCTSKGEAKPIPTDLLAGSGDATAT